MISSTWRVQRQADDRDHLAFDLDRNGNVHGLVVADAGDHGAVELGAVEADDDRILGNGTGYDVEPLAIGAIKELALVGIAGLGDERGHRLLEHADPAASVELDARAASAHRFADADCR